jgi:hypothetical protein
MLKLVHLVFDLLQPAKRRERRFMHSRTLLKVNVLRQQAQLQPSGAHDVATVRRLFLRHQLEYGRLARSVTAYQTNMLAGIDLERGATQYILRSEGFLDI